MLMSLGMFAFSIPTLAYDELQRRRDWRHADNARIGAAPASQFVGRGQDTVSITGTAFAELSDGRASIDQLVEMADSGDSWPLVDGAGQVYGAFVITGLDERQKHLLSDGTPRQIDFAIDLRRLDEPEAADQ